MVTRLPLWWFPVYGKGLSKAFQSRFVVEKMRPWWLLKEGWLDVVRDSSLWLIVINSGQVLIVNDDQWLWLMLVHNQGLWCRRFCYRALPIANPKVSVLPGILVGYYHTLGIVKGPQVIQQIHNILLRLLAEHLLFRCVLLCMHIVSNINTYIVYLNIHTQMHAHVYIASLKRIEYPCTWLD